MSLKDIRLLVADVDGVMTNGRKTYDVNGRILSKVFNDADFQAIKLLRNIGIEVAFISADQTINQEIFLRKDIEFHYAEKNHLGKRDKWKVFSEIQERHNLSLDKCCYVGNDLIDVPVLSKLEHSFCPADSYDEAKTASNFICSRSGGDGILHEIYELIYLDKLIDEYCVPDMIINNGLLSSMKRLVAYARHHTRCWYRKKIFGCWNSDAEAGNIG